MTIFFLRLVILKRLRTPPCWKSRDWIWRSSWRGPFAVCYSTEVSCLCLFIGHSYVRWHVLLLSHCPSWCAFYLSPPCVLFGMWTHGSFQQCPLWSGVYWVWTLEFEGLRLEYLSPAWGSLSLPVPVKGCHPSACLFWLYVPTAPNPSSLQVPASGFFTVPRGFATLCSHTLRILFIKYSSDYIISAWVCLAFLPEPWLLHNIGRWMKTL